MGRYEDIVFLQGDQAEEYLATLETEGEQVALEALMDWHDPGTHDTRDDTGAVYADYLSRMVSILVTS